MLGLNEIMNNPQPTKATTHKNPNNSKAISDKVFNKKSSTSTSVIDLSIELLEDNPFQPRIHYDEDALTKLALSIKKEGLLQPIEVVKHGEKYIVVYGHRRVRACKKLGMKFIRAILIESEYDDKKLVSRSLIENTQRENMNPIETAISFEKALQQKVFPNQEELGSAIGQGQAFVSKVISLLKLPEEVKDDIITNNKIKDITALDMIRKIKSDTNCKEVYFWYIESQASRAELKEKIASLEKTDSPKPIYNISYTKRGLQVELPPIDEEKKEKLEKFIVELLN